jgi:hypothetical protein
MYSACYLLLKLHVLLVLGYVGGGSKSKGVNDLNLKANTCPLTTCRNHNFLPSHLTRIFSHFQMVRVFLTNQIKEKTPNCTGWPCVFAHFD